MQAWFERLGYAGRAMTSRRGGRRESSNGRLAGEPGRAPEGADPYAGEAIARMFRLVQAMTAAGPAPLTRLRRESGLPGSAVFRLLHSLQAAGFAQQDGPRGAWRLTGRWLPVGLAALAQMNLPVLAAPALEELARIGKNTVCLLRREGAQAVGVATAAFDAAVYNYAPPGRMLPLHAGPARLLLAHAPERVQAELLARRLPRLAAGTPTDPQRIGDDLRRIRQRGWLHTTDELDPPEVAVAVPVTDHAGRVEMALAVMAPALRLRSPRPRSLSHLVPVMEETAGRIGALLRGEG